MIEEKTIKLYEYSDLNKKAKEKTLNWFRENNNYDFLSDDLEEDLKELLRVNKISFDESLKIYYSLSYSQGDGVCFEGDFEYKDYQINIKHNGNYYHKNSVDIEITNEDGESVEEDIEKEFKDIFDDICDELEIEGYGHIEYDSIIHGYKFLEDGSFWKF